MNAQAQANAAQQLVEQQAREAVDSVTGSNDVAAGLEADAAAMAANPKIEEEDDGEEADATGLEENDIKLVMDQASTTRNKAVKALKKNDGDIVNSIMSLTI